MLKVPAIPKRARGSSMGENPFLYAWVLAAAHHGLTEGDQPFRVNLERAIRAVDRLRQSVKEAGPGGLQLIDDEEGRVVLRWGYDGPEAEITDRPKPDQPLAAPRHLRLVPDSSGEDPQT